MITLSQYYCSYTLCRVRLLAICDDCAAQYDIIFNAEKSEFPFTGSHKRRFLYNMCACSFFINLKVIENVKQHPHIEHMITSAFNDNDDIIQDTY
jgi:hypothetical protein